MARTNEYYVTLRLTDSEYNELLDFIPLSENLDDDSRIIDLAGLLVSLALTELSIGKIVPNKDVLDDIDEYHEILERNYKQEQIKNIKEINISVPSKQYDSVLFVSDAYCMHLDNVIKVLYIMKRDHYLYAPPEIKVKKEVIIASIGDLFKHRLNH